MIEVTPEMRQAVAEDECRRDGHTFDEVLDYVTGEPRRITCHRCGRTWPVGAGQGGAAPINQPDPPDPPAAGTGFVTPEPLRPQPGLGDEDSGDYGRG